MNSFQKSSNNYLSTILLIGLAFFVISFANLEKNSIAISSGSSICLLIDIHSNTQAVIPASTDLPIRASFTDENHIILNQSFVTDYSINLRIDKAFRYAQEKHLLIKPFVNKVVRRLIFPDPKPVDFIAFC